MFFKFSPTHYSDISGILSVHLQFAEGLLGHVKSKSTLGFASGGTGKHPKERTIGIL